MNNPVKSSIDDGAIGAGAPVNRGQPSLARNVASSWLYYFVVVIAGFIVPRLIDRHEGQQLLGVWDLGWTLVAYVALLQLGIVAAVNRYVSRYVATGDWDSLNESVSSSMGLLLVSGFLGLVVGFALQAVVPVLLDRTDPEIISIARWTMFLLVVSASFKLPVGALEGVITGCERYDVLNLIRICREVVTVVLMVLVLLAGHGVASLALVVLGCELIASVVKWRICRHVCPDLRISVRYVSRGTLREMLAFGGKTMMQILARTGLYHFNSLLVAYFLGPLVLAVYSRQRVLVFHALRFLKKYSNVFIPTCGRLQARGDIDGLRKLMIEGSRYGFYITLPIMGILLAMGGPLLEVWMGREYRAPLVLGILALGHTLALPQETAYSVLMGMGRHGVPSVIELISAACGVGLCAIALGPFGAGMTAAALAIAIPVTIAGGVVAPAYACRELGLNFGRYVRSVMLGPLLAVIPFVALLILARLAWPHSALHCVVFGIGLGGLLLLGVYWIWVVPDSFRASVMDRFAIKAAVRSADAA